jgi:hypothetical protein
LYAHPVGSRSDVTAKTGFVVTGGVTPPPPVGGTTCDGTAGPVKTDTRNEPPHIWLASPAQGMLQSFTLAGVGGPAA